MVQFTAKKVASLRFVSNNTVLREELYKEFGNEVYDKKATDKLEQSLLNYFMLDNDDEETEDGEAEITLASLPKKKQKIVKQLCDTAIWQRDLDLMNHAKKMAEIFGDKLFDDFNVFEEKFDKELKKQNIKLTAKDKKDLLGVVSWADPKAAAVIKKKSKDGSIEYISDPALKDYENIPLKEDIQTFFEREVIPFADDAWWNADETKIGYEININKHFYEYTPPRNKADIAADLFAIEHETENLLKEIVG
jgi:type I restriction enzyme M protein